jgi:hypothetical protein
MHLVLEFAFHDFLLRNGIRKYFPYILLFRKELGILKIFNIIVTRKVQLMSERGIKSPGGMINTCRHGCT